MRSMVRIVFYNAKTNPRREIKCFFPNKFKRGVLKDQRDVLLNAIKLSDGRNKIIKLFEENNIVPSDFPI